MDTSWYRRLLAAMFALMLAASLSGCTGAPRGGNQPGTDRGGPGIGGTSSPNLSDGTRGMNLGGGSTGMSVASPTGRTELGQEISFYVANLLRGGGLTSAGVTVAPRATIGVSTLIIGNTAYVGIDPYSAGLMPGGTSRGATTGGTTGATTGGTTGATTGGTTGGTTSRTTGGATPAALTSLVQARIHAAFPQVGDVFVTADPTLVSRIASIAADVRTGTSTAGRLNEIVAIARAMTPASGPG